jgi:hypothetical protein
MAPRSYTILLETAEPLDEWLEELITRELDGAKDDLKTDVVDQFDLRSDEEEELVMDYTVEGGQLIVRALIPTEMHAAVVAENAAAQRAVEVEDASA